MAFPNATDLVATTIENRSKKIQDNVTKNNAILFQLSQNKRIRTFSGGTKILEELSFAENGNAGWYSGYDQLAIGAQDVLTAAEYSIKQLAVPVAVSGLEEIQNHGPEAFLDLLEERVKVAEATMANTLADGLYSDGTGSGSKELTGLDAAVPQDPTTGTYGGINRATWTFWRSQLNDPGSTPTSSTIQAEMTTLYLACSRGSDKPDLIMSGNTIYKTFIASLQANQRFTNSKLADAGFQNAEFMGTPVVFDGGIGGFATADDMYFLNTKYLSLRPAAGRNMKALKQRSAVNQDASVTILVWAGNLTCSGSKFQGRLKGD